MKIKSYLDSKIFNKTTTSHGLTDIYQIITLSEQLPPQAYIIMDNCLAYVRNNGFLISNCKINQFDII